MGVPNNFIGQSDLANQDPICVQLRAYENDLRLSSDAMLGKLNTYFMRWERRHGFRAGAGKILVPAGYDPNNPRGVVA